MCTSFSAVGLTGRPLQNCDGVISVIRTSRAVRLNEGKRECDSNTTKTAMFYWQCSWRRRSRLYENPRAKEPVALDGMMKGNL